MDVSKVLKELHAERERIDASIASLQRLALALGQKRRGRPPKRIVEARKKAATAPTAKTTRK